MKKLPKIYQNTITKKINNNEKVYYAKSGEISPSNIEEYEEESNISEIINSVFNDITYAFNIDLIIETKNKTYNTSLVTKTSSGVITFDNDFIKYEDIISIKRKKS